MRVMGIDASTKKSSLAVFEDGAYVEHILIDKHKIGDTETRMAQMMCEMCEYLDAHKVDKIIMEKSVLKSNADTLQKLSMLSGAIMYYAAKNGVEFENPVPSSWRKLCGLEQSSKVKRAVLKAEAIKAVEQEYGMTVSDDEAEAILLARSGFDLPKIGIKADDVEIDAWGDIN